ncbi:hypothetical protein L950_0215175 [Sphingobacterium sp. IITKGP-BTPF85]|nr:hypothetical protein L950_0215175 [Sphingobacterium sp. IITKGP-BTPF85]
MSKNQNQNNAGQANKPSQGSSFQDNQKSITFIVGGIFVLIILYFGYQNFIYNRELRKQRTKYLKLKNMLQ